MILPLPPSARSLRASRSLPPAHPRSILSAAGWGCAATAVALTMYGGTARAATFSWDGGGADNNWQTAPNWSTDVAPLVGSILNFAGTNRLTPTNDFTSGSSFAGVSFDATAGAFTLGGNPITLTGGITNGSTVTQTFASGLDLALGANLVVSTLSGSTTSNVTINGVISGSARTLTKGDASTGQTSTLTLNGTNTYTGGTTVYSGSLSTANLANGGSASGIGASSNAAANLVFGSTSSGGITGVLRYTGATASTDRLFTDNRLAALDASGTGAITFSNAGTIAMGATANAHSLTLQGSNTGNNTLYPVIPDYNNGTNYATSVNKNGSGTWVLAGTNTFTGTTTVNAGTLRLDYSLNTSGNQILAAASTTFLNGGTLEIKGGSTAATQAFTGGFRFNQGESTINLVPGAGSTVALTTTQFLRNIGAVGVLNLPTGASFNTTAAITLQNGIVPGLIANGTDLVTYDTTNGFTALPGASYSTLAGAGQTLPSSATTPVNVRITSGSTGNVTLASSPTYVNSLTINDPSARTISIGSTQTLNFANAASKVGTVLIPTGTGAVTIGDTAGVGNVSVGLSASNNTSELLLYVNSTNGLTINSNVVNLGTSGVSATTPSLTKSGSGPTTLTGTNTYLGATRVNAGTLFINGNQTAATGAVTVALGATLGGTGTIGGATTINDGGNLAPGTATSTGLLSFSSSLTMVGTTESTMLRIQGPTRGVVGGYDAINVGTALTYAGALTLNVSGLSPGTYDLFNFNTETGDLASILVTGTGGYNGALADNAGLWSGTISGTSFSFSTLTGDLNVTAVPEPRAWGFLILPLAVIGYWQRRRSPDRA